MENKNTILIILDGWGIGDGSKSDVISQTPTPNIHLLKKNYPNSQLITCGENVGLPDGQMGNSEVGHLTIGAGRVIYQDLVRVNKAVADKSLFSNPTLLDAFHYAKDNNKSVHFLGLVSDGGVHSHIDHLIALCEMTTQNNLSKVFIHALMDGRDTDPRSGKGYLEYLEEKIVKTKAKVATVCGRYYTMDRDKRWDRVKLGYDLLVSGKGNPYKSAMDAINDSYKNEKTDEFVLPSVIVDENGNPLTTIKEGDVVIGFNFRTDRLREITLALCEKDMEEFGMKTLPLYYVTLTRYDETYKKVKVVFDNQNANNTLGEVVSSKGFHQLRIAETEKYAHVTFFFSGGREEVFPLEDRIMKPSPKVATYDLQPEMSARLIKDAVIEAIKTEKYRFICLNFANGDMVGHTGVYSAIQEAIKTVDECVGEVIEVAKKHNFEALIIADHGNADFALNADGSPNTAHSLNPVPCILVSDRFKTILPGTLADVAPTLLTLMNIEIPIEMTGKVLV